MTKETKELQNYGIVSLKSFLLGLGLSVTYFSPIWVVCLAYGAVGLSIVYLISKNDEIIVNNVMTYFQVRIRAFFLGWGLSCGIHLIVVSGFMPFGLYICLLCIFHYSEFLVTSFISPETLSLDSFLLNHSKEYGIAAVASVFEFFTEFYFFPYLKECTIITIIGTVFCIGGEVLRKSSMLTASKNFTHLVRERKVDGQYLVTTGPYAFCRHPGYAGWFWWSIGTQLVMINPICFIGYCFAVLRFFRSRIYYEEICLLSFFGLEYAEYQKNVPHSGVPFVRGYLALEEEESTTILHNTRTKEE